MFLAFPKLTVPTTIAVFLGLIAGIGITAVTVPISQAAEVGKCYNYKANGTKDQAAITPAIDCITPHTAQTYWSGTLPQNFGVPEKAKAANRLKVTQACTVKNMNSFINLGERKLPSRFQSLSIFPPQRHNGMRVSAGYDAMLFSERVRATSHFKCRRWNS